MSALFDELGIEVMHTGDGALRLGVLYDLLGRDVEHDKRDESVRQFMKRYHVDANLPRASRRAALFDAMMPEGAERAELRTALGWAADLHEVGLSIAHNAYHKHTAYVLENADMPGFSRADQQLLALLALGHQGKLSKLEPLVRNHAQWTAILSLRLAVLLFRRRGEIEPLPLTASVRGDSIVVRVNKEWLAQHPLSDFTLRAEEAEWSGGLFVPGAGVLTATAPGFASDAPVLGRFFSILEREGSGERNHRPAYENQRGAARHAGFLQADQKATSPSAFPDAAIPDAGRVARRISLIFIRRNRRRMISAARSGRVDRGRSGGDSARPCRPSSAAPGSRRR